MALISNGNRTEWSTIRSVILTTTTTAVKTSLKKEFAFFQTQLRLFGPAQYVKCRQLFLELNSYGFQFFKFKKRKENSSSYVHILHKTSN